MAFMILLVRVEATHSNTLVKDVGTARHFDGRGVLIIECFTFTATCTIDYREGEQDSGSTTKEDK